MALKMERSRGNVFHDLGFDAKESESLRIRAELMAEIKRVIQGRKLTQREAAKLFGVTQPRMSDLVRGKLDLFSIETLINMLVRAGIHVQLRLVRTRYSRSAQAA
jgi:predicted XRE-type DNA-binding protein